MKRLLLVLAVAVAALSAGVGRSTATFVDSSSVPASSFASSPVFNGVAVTLADPGTPLRATVPLSATATSDRALVSVTFERSPAEAGTWATICAPTAAPFNCSWNTTGLTDGLYDLRSVALDASGYSRTSSVTSRRVDNTAPSTTNTTTGPLTGTATVTATATDAGSGVLSVAFEAKPSAASTWSPICTDGSSPYSCSWTTSGDGDYDIRATTTDNAGNTSSSTVTRGVDNTAPTITLTDPGAMTTGETLASATADGSGSGVATVTYQYRTNGGTTWSTACSSAGAPFSCTWGTLPADGLYDLRATATDGVGLSTTSAILTARRVDTVIPSSATITNPGTPLRGTVTLNGTGADAASGMDSMRFEYKLSSGSTWATACTDATPPSPFSCGWDTTTVADGTYDLRSVAIDAAGNVRNSTAVTARVVDNTGPAVSVTAPGMFRTSTTVNATASDNVAVATVAIQYAVSGSGTYTTICTDNLTPFSCAWNAAALTDGPYDVRAIATDTAGNQTTSAVVAAYVNNTGPTGTDVQGTNGGVNDKLDAGDTVVFTYSANMRASSILAGWSGASTAIKVRVNNTGTSDSMEFYDSANTTPLGLLATGTALAINIDHVTAPSVFNATIALSGANVTVTIGSLVSGSVNGAAKGKNAMVWQTSSQALSTAGKPVLPTTVTESGPNDLDF